MLCATSAMAWVSVSYHEKLSRLEPTPLMLAPAQAVARAKRTARGQCFHPARETAASARSFRGKRRPRDAKTEG